MRAITKAVNKTIVCQNKWMMTSSTNLSDLGCFFSLKISKVFFLLDLKLNKFWKRSVVHVAEHLSSPDVKLIWCRKGQTMISSCRKLTDFLFKSLNLLWELNIIKISMSTLPFVKLWPAPSPTVELTLSIKRHWMVVPTTYVDDMFSIQSLDQMWLTWVFLVRREFLLSKFAV